MGMPGEHAKPGKFPRSNRVIGNKKRKMSDKNPDLQFLARSIPSRELEVLKANLLGEKGEYFRKMLVDLEKRIRRMPALKPEKDLDAPIFLHYFIGDTHCWISYLDLDEMIGFGFIVRDNDWKKAELCHVWITEIVDFKVGPFQAELDLRWNTETKLRDVMREIHDVQQFRSRKRKMIEDKL